MLWMRSFQAAACWGLNSVDKRHFLNLVPGKSSLREPTCLEKRKGSRISVTVDRQKLVANKGG
jgi:hypothetical protein